MITIKSKNAIINIRFKCNTSSKRIVISILPELRIERIENVFYYIYINLLCFGIYAAIVHIPERLRKNSMYTNLLN